MNENDLGDLVAQHKWLAATAVVIGVAVRLLKSDTKIPIDVPPRARIWLVLGLGVASSVLEKVATGAQWEKALVDGLVGAFVAVIGHETMIASLRSGKEIPVPGLMVPGAAPSPGKPATIPPVPPDAPTLPAPPRLLDTLPPSALVTDPPAPNAAKITPVVEPVLDTTMTRKVSAAKDPNER